MTGLLRSLRPHLLDTSWPLVGRLNLISEWGGLDPQRLTLLIIILRHFLLSLLFPPIVVVLVALLFSTFITFK